MPDSGALEQVYINALKTAESKKLLEDIHAGLSLYFKDGELEPLEGFHAVLEKNADPDWQRYCGPFEEALVALRHRATGEILGAFSHIVFLHGAPAQTCASVQDIYVYVASKFRGQKLGAALFDMRRRAVLDFCARSGMAQPQLFFFAEQNNPLKMTPREYAQDAALGLDPVERVKASRAHGLYPLAFDYVQSPLAQGGQTVRMMDLCVQCAEGARERLPGALVGAHLEKFLEVSVLKSIGAAARDPEAAQMLAFLREQEMIGVRHDHLDGLQCRIQAYFDDVAAGRAKAQDNRPLGQILREAGAI